MRKRLPIPQKVGTMTKCIGYQKKKGDFTKEGTTEKIFYDNIILYLISDEVPEGVIGKTVSEIKIKTDAIKELFKAGDVTLETIIDRDIMFCYSILAGKPVLTGIV